MSKKDGSALTEAEARGVLEPYGKVELCVPAESNHLNIRGMYVKFAFYLDCRDALKVRMTTSQRRQHTNPQIQNHNNMKSPYTIVLAPAMEPRFNLGPDGLLMVRGFASPRSIMDARSIFVGNLPEFATRPEVEALFQEFGSIIQTNIIKKAFSKSPVQPLVPAFPFAPIQTLTLGQPTEESTSLHSLNSHTPTKQIEHLSPR